MRPEARHAGNPATPNHDVHSRVRRIIPTILLIILGVMIVRDILVRRWSPATPPASDVAQRSR